MVRLIEAIVTNTEDGTGNAMPELRATLIMFCAIAAMLSIIVFVCGLSSGKNHKKPQPAASNVMYYGPGGTAYPAAGYPPPAYGGYPAYQNTGGYPAYGKPGGGMGNAAVGVAAGAAAGLAAGLIIDDIVDNDSNHSNSGGGGGCGGGDGDGGGGGCGGGCGGCGG